MDRENGLVRVVPTGPSAPTQSLVSSGGHFAQPLGITVVPEPSTSLQLVVGWAWLVAIARRRARR